MEEINVGSQGNPEPNLKEKVNRIFAALESGEKKEIKKTLKLPRKAKVSKSRMKKGWIGILFANPNKVVRGEKVQLESGTYKTKDGNYHITDGHEIAWWEGKHPFIWQRYDKLNPTNLFPKEGDKDEIYGQDSIMLRMKRDLIKEKKKNNGGMLKIVIIIAALYFGVKAFLPNLFGGG